jgi:hypothetical protein
VSQRMPERHTGVGAGGRTGPGFDPGLTRRQWEEVERRLGALQQSVDWQADLPVLLLERCWLRLSCVSLDELLQCLPPDASREAPELARYRELVASGLPGWEAQLECWQEFGPEPCREAQRRYWNAQERGNRGWTTESYLALVRDYRQRFLRDRPRPLPLLVLGRQDGFGVEGRHRLVWLRPRAGDPEHPMRHTCP